VKTCVIYPFIPKGSLPKRVDEETVGKRLTQSRLKNGRLNSGWFVVEFLSRATLAELRGGG